MNGHPLAFAPELGADIFRRAAEVGFTAGVDRMFDYLAWPDGNIDFTTFVVEASVARFAESLPDTLNDRSKDRMLGAFRAACKDGALAFLHLTDELNRIDADGWMCDHCADERLVLRRADDPSGHRAAAVCAGCGLLIRKFPHAEAAEVTP